MLKTTGGKIAPRPSLFWKRASIQFLAASMARFRQNIKFFRWPDFNNRLITRKK